jgi:hypothetical protein
MSKRKPYSSNVASSVGSEEATIKAIIRLLKPGSQSPGNWSNGSS